MGPIVIVGGFILPPGYRGMQRELSVFKTGRPVLYRGYRQGHDMLMAVSKLGWAKLLAELDRAVLAGCAKFAW